MVGVNQYFAMFKHNYWLRTKYNLQSAWPLCQLYIKIHKLTRSFECHPGGPARPLKGACGTEVADLVVHAFGLAGLPQLCGWGMTVITLAI